MVELRWWAGWALRIAAGQLQRAADALVPLTEEQSASELEEPDGPEDDGMWGVSVPDEALAMVADPPRPPEPPPKPKPLPGSAAARLAAALGEE